MERGRFPIHVKRNLATKTNIRRRMREVGHPASLEHADKKPSAYCPGGKPAGQKSVDCLDQWEKLVIRGAGYIRVGRVWDLLRAKLPTDKYALVKGVKRIQALNGAYIIYVSSSARATLKEALVYYGRQEGWAIHDWKNMPKNHLHAQGVREELREHKLLVTWNINRWKTKRAEVANYLGAKEPLFVCIQETWCGEKDWKPRLKGYTSYHQPAVDGTHKNGVLVLVRNSVRAAESVGIEGYLQAVKAFNIDGKQPWTVASLYRPPADRGLLGELRVWMEKVRAGEPTVIAGDWNRNGEQIVRFLRTVKGSNDWYLVGMRGSPHTRKHNDIDHIVVSGAALAKIGQGVVDRTVDLSDHWPIVLPRLRGTLDVSQNTSEAKKRLNTQKVKTAAKTIALSNRWEVLTTLEDTSVLADTFAEVSQGICTDESLYEERRGGERSEHLPAALKSLIQQRRNLYVKIQKTPKDDRVPLIVEYRRLKKMTKEGTRKFHEATFQNWIKKGCKAMTEGDSAAGWRWLHRTAGIKSREGLATTVYTKDKESVILEPDKVAERWSEHFAELASDGNSHSLDRTYWEDRLQDLEEKPEWMGINRVISWAEVKGAVKAMPRGRAAGTDGLPAEWFQAIVDGDEPDLEGKPTTPGGKAVLHLLQSVFVGEIPKSWKIAVIVPIFKKGGDRLDPGDHRGISLIQVCLKALAKIVERRLTKAAADHQVLMREQTGFRRKEECVALYATLHQACRHRLAQNLPTYVSFLDLKKAYDSVPIEAMLLKLEKRGIRGATLDFLRRLYRASKGAVKVGDILSQPFDMIRGVRQGCPLSPLLFNIFINDCLDEVPHGVRIQQVIRGGLFADDIALMQETAERHQDALDQLYAWAKRYKMTFGIKKCGHLIVGPGLPVLMFLGDDPLPIVTSYRYLGIPFQKDLGLEEFITQKLQSVRNAVRKAMPLLQCRLIPIGMRVRYLKAHVMSHVQYGGELLGFGYTKHAAKIQTAINVAVRALWGRNKMVAMAAVFQELALKPVLACWATAHIRAVGKWQTSQTVATTLFERHAARKRSAEEPLEADRRKRRATLADVSWHSALRQTWHSKGCSLIKKYLGPGQPVGSSMDQSQRVVSKILSCKSGGKALQRYAEDGLASTTSYIKTGIRYPEWTKGLELLLQDRCGTIFAPNHAVRWGYLPNDARDVCVACDSAIASRDHIDHVVYDCGSYTELRYDLFKDWSGASAIAEVPGSDVGGERKRACLIGKTRSGIALIENWLGLSQQSEGDSSIMEDGGNNMSPRLLENEPGFVRVAKFYQLAVGDWQRKLWIKIRQYRESIGRPIPSCQRADAYDGPTDRHAPSPSSLGRDFS